MSWLSRFIKRTRQRWSGVAPPAWERLGEEYDRQTLEVFRRVLRPDSNCLDIGAHIGSLLGPILKHAPRGRHHAFEPIPTLAAKLRKKFPRVAVHEVALSDHAGRTSFCLVENALAWSGLRPRSYGIEQPQVRQIEVQVARADDLVPADLPITLIKLDTEGGEYHALLGAERIITQHRPYIVFEAGAGSTGQYDVTPDDLFTLLVDRYGLRLSTMARWLAAAAPYSRAEFARNWIEGPDFYFLAYPP